MNITPITHEGYKLFHQGIKTFAEIEHNGVKIDMDYLNKTISDITNKIKREEKKLKASKIYAKWKRQYGKSINLNSRAQLGYILYKKCKFESHQETATGRPKTDAEALSQIDHSFVRRYVRINKLKDANAKFLKAIRRETIDGYLRAFLNLHIPRTLRSSSDSPNLHNTPKRDPMIKNLVRGAFIPRANNRCIVSCDYGGIEVHGACWYHHDPTMYEYLEDKAKDMHRDMAMQCMMLPQKEMNKAIRFLGKNMFVFPQFYGDYYINCAVNMWREILNPDLKTESGMSVLKWLRKKGIKERGACNSEESPVSGTFEYHMKEVEYDFWNNRFKVYNEWRINWVKAYNQRGYFDMLSGFRLSGYLDKNQIINYPVQGVAFHCLLWSIIRLQKLIKKYKMKTLLINEIHDDIIADVPEKEVDDYLELAHQVMIVDIKKHWKFITTPIEIEAQVAPPGKSWNEIKEREIKCQG